MTRISCTVRCVAHGLLALSLAVPSGVWGQVPAPPPPPAAAVQPSAPLSREQLEQLVAPIALYPDSLIAQILMASTYPLEIVQAARWSKQHPAVKSAQLEAAMQQQPWDPSVKSLTAVPQVVTMMSDKLDWTQRLGDAFLGQQKDVLDAVQRLRAKAQAAGNLTSTSEQKVIVQQQVIVIEPTNPQVVYVPTYNPVVVYGVWPYAAYPPYYWYPPGHVAAAGIISFGIGVAVGSALWGNCNWHGGDITINHNVYNNFNKTNIQGGNWNHNPEHRKGIAYRDQATAQTFGRGGQPGSRETSRGRAEQGRQGAGQGAGGLGSGRQHDFDAFEGMGSGGQTREYSDRGRASSESMERNRGRGPSVGGARAGAGGGRGR